MSKQTADTGSNKKTGKGKDLPGMWINDKEIWKFLPGSGREYKVSSLGRVKTLKKRKFGAILKQRPKKGYMRIALRIGGKRKDYGVHQLVWISFNGPIPEGIEPNHKDGNKKNNRLTNLELGTHGHNIKEAYRLGLIPSRVGERNTKARFTEEIVKDMRRSFRPGVRGEYARLARIWDTSRANIRCIILGETWSHI